MNNGVILTVDYTPMTAGSFATGLTMYGAESGVVIRGYGLGAPCLQGWGR